MDLERAVTHPATQHTAPAWGAQPGEPLPLFPRALRRTLLDMGISAEVADRILDTGRPLGEGGKGKGQRRKGGGKGKGKGKW